MRIVRIASVAAVIMALAMAGSLKAVDAAAPLTADEVKKLVAAGQYQDALKGLLRILDLKGPAAAAYDRHEMLMLRAECQLQIKQNTSALDTLELARKEAVAAANDDHAMEASALALLIKSSPAGMYTPQTGTVRKPIPIADRILRKGAYDALFADQMAQVTVKVKQAKIAGKLAPLADAAKQVVAVRPVEKASAGDNKVTDQVLSDLAQQSLKMLSTAVDDLSTETQRISDSANRIVTENVQLTDARGMPYQVQQTHRVGLTQGDTTSLKNVIAECGKIATAATELAQIISSSDPAPFKAVATKATTTKDKATSVLKDNYSGNIH